MKNVNGPIVINFTPDDVFAKTYITSYIDNEMLFCIYEYEVITARDSMGIPLGCNKIISCDRVNVNSETLKTIVESSKHFNKLVDLALKTENVIKEIKNV